MCACVCACVRVYVSQRVQASAHEQAIGALDEISNVLLNYEDDDDLNARIDLVCVCVCVCVCVNGLLNYEDDG